MKRIAAFIPRPGTAATMLVCIALTPLLFASQPALTIYNQNFSVVRDSVPLDLKQGVNDVRFTETTAHLEPDSVILRDPQGKTNLQVLEQNYRNFHFMKAKQSNSKRILDGVKRRLCTAK